MPCVTLRIVNTLFYHNLAMASTSSVVALKAILEKQGYSERLLTLSDMRTCAESRCASLEVEQAEINNEEGVCRWVIVCTIRYYITVVLRRGPIEPRLASSADSHLAQEIQTQ